MPLHFGAWVAFLDPTPRGTSQPTTQLFSCKCILQGAIDFAVMRMRSGVGAAVANGGAECRTFFGVAGFAPNP